MGLRGSCAEQQLHLVQLRLDEHRRTAHGFTVFVETTLDMDVGLVLL